MRYLSFVLLCIPFNCPHLAISPQALLPPFLSDSPLLDKETKKFYFHEKFLRNRPGKLPVLLASLLSFIYLILLIPALAPPTPRFFKKAPCASRGKSRVLLEGQLRVSFVSVNLQQKVYWCDFLANLISQQAYAFETYILLLFAFCYIQLYFEQKLRNEEKMQQELGEEERKTAQVHPTLT